MIWAWWAFTDAVAAAWEAFMEVADDGMFWIAMFTPSVLVAVLILWAVR